MAMAQSGKRLVHAKVRVHGVDPFQHSPDYITILASEWSQNPIVRKDIVVEQVSAPRML
jgi:CCR4-NOT complex subunit CAF16